MPSVAFLWHLHQPAYRTADGVARAPWVAVHAGGAYTTLVRSLLETGAPGQTVNLSPTLVEQLEAYAAGDTRDPLADALCCPAGDLDAAGRERLLEWGFFVTARQLERAPRLAELRRRGDRLATANLRDLQVLFILLQAGDQAWRDDELDGLLEQGGGFSSADHERVAGWFRRQPARLLEAIGELRDAGVAELSTNPYAHPIVPLLVDTGIVSASWAPRLAPDDVPAFRYPEDARRQVADGLRFARERGVEPVGCWPSEGAVSEAAVALYAEAGVRWLVTDEGVLARSLGRDLRTDEGADPDLSRTWRTADAGTALLFRDRELSDRIGFVFGRSDDEARAAAALAEEIELRAAVLPDDAVITIALDGENPWLGYPRGGGEFLRELLSRLGGLEGVEPVTVGEAAARTEPAVLDRLHPGSWIRADFSTWIGHPEKIAAWDALAKVRAAVGEAGRPHVRSMLLAEGSDWMWWLGDDNPTPLSGLYDRIFRHHLADACEQAGIAPPLDLDTPLKRT